MQAYVQQLLPSDTSFLSFEQLAHWFQRREYDVVRFDTADLENGMLDRALLKRAQDTVVTGGVKTVDDALRRAGRPRQEIPSLPDELAPWIDRDHWVTTHGELNKHLRDNPDSLPLHIKPVNRAKLFTGFILRHPADLNRVSFVNDDELILVQELISIRSEWRTYVLRDRIVHTARYFGDPLIFPDAGAMRDALQAYENRPIAFSMDWGVTDDGKTLLIELNDATSLGNYGLRGDVHTAMIEARWRELMGLQDNGIGEGLC